MINRRKFLQASVATSALSLLPRSVRGQTSSKSRPNVLFLMVDDMRPELNCYGVREVKSPNIDRLAAKGVRFDRAYCQFPVCNPSRSSMITGLRPETLNIFTNRTEDCFRLKRPDVVTMPQLFRENGYHTASFGKVMGNGINASGKVVPSDDPASWEVCEEGGISELKLPGEKVDYVPKFRVKGSPDWCWWKSALNMDGHADIRVAMRGLPDKKTGYTPMDGRSVRTDRWRYTEWSNGDIALFDHEKDPGEYYNLASGPEYKETCAQLKEVLHRIQKA